MNVIKYSADGERLAFTPDSSGQLEFSFPEGTEGAVIISTEMIRIKDGTARMYVGQLEDGIHTPYLSASGTTVRMEAIRILGRRVDVCRTEDFVIRALLDRVRTMESALSAALKKIEDLAKSISGNGLFEE